ncbi:MAG: DUF2341 domain-containing protein [bacterium]
MRKVFIFCSSLYLSLCLISFSPQKAFTTTTVKSQYITESATWTTSGSPYIVEGDVYVQGNDNPVLTIEPGVTVKFNQNVRLVIGHNSSNYYAGRLRADGQPGTGSIIFTANQGTPTSGFWRGIYFAQYSSGSSLNNVVVEYGGHTEEANIICYNSSPSIINSIIRQSSKYGIRLQGSSSPQITNCIITNNAHTGIYCDDTNPSPTITNCIFSNNNSYPVCLGANAAGKLTNNTFDSNAINAVEVRGQTINTSGTWTNQGVPYVLTGDVTVQGSNYSNPVLIIEPGVTVKFNQNVWLYIGHNDSSYYAGRLRADGQPGTGSIIFTANHGTPTSGFWRGIYFAQYSSGSSLNNVVVEYGGHTEEANILCHNSSPPITNSIIRHSSKYGIRLQGSSSPQITNCIFSNNNSYPVCVGANAVEKLSNNTFDSNAINAVEVLGETINTSGTWTNQNVPYVLTGDVTVQGSNYSNPVLTIEPGVTVKFNQNVWLFIGNSGSDYYAGRLRANGQPGTGSIVFTANQGTPPAGFWRGIYFAQYSSGSSLNNVVVEYGGYVEEANIICYRSSPSITYSIIRHSSKYGIRLQGSSSPQITNCIITNNAHTGIYCDDTNPSPTITNCIFSNNNSYAVCLGANAAGKLTNNTFANNAINAVEVLGQTINTSGTWTNQGVPYVLTGDVTVQGSNYSNPVLTIEPGVTVKFNQNVRLVIGDSGSDYYGGRLRADGQPGTGSIIFTANHGTPTSGFWRGIYFAQYSSGSSLNNVVVEYGGYEEANIVCYRSSPPITYSIIRHSSKYGIRLQGSSSPQITNCIITNNAHTGIYCDDATPSPTITNCIFSNNNYYPVCLGANAVGKLTNNTFANNAINAVEVLGQIINTSGTWTNQGVPYVLTRDVTVKGSNYSNPALTIEPGVTVKFNQNVRLVIGDTSSDYYAGRLRADGQPGTGSIIFTANQGTPTSGFWRGIYFAQYSSGSSLNNVVVEYGGYTAEEANIVCYRSSPPITYSIIRQSSKYGIRLQGSSSPQITNCIITNNATTGIYCENTANPRINFCDIVANRLYGVYNSSSNIINAENNWWGDKSGPSGVGTGTGDAVSARVDYIPWQGSPYSDDIPPQAVTDLRVGTVSDIFVNLIWTVPQEVTHYEIRYATFTINEANWGLANSTGKIYTKGGTEEVYVVSGLEQNLTYYFRLKIADMVSNWSGLSNEVSTRTFLPGPSNLVAGVIWEDKIKLFWQDNSNIEVGFSLERKAGQGEYIEIGTVTANVRSYEDTKDVATGTLYTYRVRAYNNLGYSEYSNEATATTSAWQYQTIVFINNNSNPATLTDYQVMLTLTPALFDYSRANPDGSDLRFRNSALLSYWIETWNTNGTSTIWINVPEIPASSTQIITMHYGLSGVAKMNNGENTFDLFDDFFFADTNKFSYGQSYHSNSPLIYNITADNLLEVYSDNGWKILNMKKTWLPAETFAIKIRFKEAGASNWHTHYLVEVNNLSANRFGWQEGNNLQWRIEIVEDGSWGYSNYLANLTANTFYKAELIKKAAETIEGKIYTDSQELLANYARISSAWSDESWTWVTWKYYPVKSYYDWIFVRKYTDPEPVVTLSSSLSEIVPDTGINSATVSVTITARGAGFLSGAMVKLSRTGYEDIIGTNTIILTNQTLTTTFDLTDKPVGYWDVVVCNPEQLPMTLRNGFFIRDIVIPIPEIITPTDEGIISGSNVKFSAQQINGNDGLRTIWEIFVAGNWWVMGTSTNPANNFSIFWNSTLVPSDGTYTVRARLFDTMGNEGTDTITVIIDNTAPIPQITQPENGSVVKDDVLIKAKQINGSDGILVTYEIFTMNKWQLIGTSSDRTSDFPVVWNSLSVLDGSYTLRVVMKDYAGLVGNSTVIIKVDNTNPIPEIIQPTDGADISGEQIFKAQQINGNDAIITVWEILINNNWILMGSSTNISDNFAIFWNSDLIQEGTYTVLATMKDIGGSSGTDSIMVNIDRTKPSSTILSPIDGMVLNNLTQISGTASDTPSLGKISKVEINIKRNSDDKYWHGSGWQITEIWLLSLGTESWRYNWTPADGSYTLRSRATDGAGNLEIPKAGITFTYDATPPPINIIYPVADSIINTNIVDVRVETEPEVTVRIVDPQTGQEISRQSDSQGSVTFASLVFKEGLNNIVVKTIDLLGNIGQKGINFVVDTTPLYTSGHLPAKNASDVARNTNIKLNIKDDGAGVNLSSIIMKVKGGTVTSGMSISGNKYNYTLIYDPPVDFGVGEIVEVEIYASDMNPQPYTIYETYTFTIILDKTPPETTIIPLSPDPTKDNTPSFTGQAIDTISNVVAIEYRLNGGSWTNVEPFTPARIVNYSLTTPALTDGTYTIEIRARDEIGNTETTYSQDKFEIDTISPVPPIIISPTPGVMKGGILVVRGTGESNTQVWVYLSGVNKGIGNCVNGIWEVPINILDGTYSLTATLKDKAGNVSDHSQAVQITIDSSLPTVNITTPTLNSIIDTTTVTVRGNTEPQILVITTNPQTNQPITSRADNNGNFIFPNLIFNEGNNVIVVKAIDEVGNIGQGQVDFYVDTAAPYTCCHIPARGATDVPRKTNIRLNIKDDGTGIQQSSIIMKINHNIVTPTITGNPSNYLLNYTPGVDFNFGDVVQVEVYAQDMNPQPRNIQETYSFTIGIDTSPPQSFITPLTPDPTSNTTPKFNGSAWDSLSYVDRIEYRVDEGSWQDVEPFTRALRVDYSFTITPPLLAGRHKVEVRAIDTEGNTQTTYAITTFTIDTILPSAPTGVNILFYPDEYGKTATMHLIWQANPETDIAGYNVYRNSEKINSTRISDTFYYDFNLTVGQEYKYWVTAVDKAGNESNPSAEIKFVPTCLYGPPLEIYCESFIRGGTGKVKVKFTNHGLATLNVYTSRNDKPVDDLMVYVKTFEGKILAEGKIYQYDDQVVKFEHYSYARVTPNSSFMFAEITVNLPGETPDNVMVEAVIQKSHYDQRPAINGPGLKASIMFPVSEPAYLVTADTDKDMYNQEEVVTISGLATDSEDGTPVAYALVKIGIKTKGIARYNNVSADENGSYTYKFIPIPGEAGKYTVWAVHPDVIVEECDTTFTILGLAIKPNKIEFTMSKNNTDSFHIAVHNIGETPLAEVRLNIIDKNPADGVTGKVSPSVINLLQPGEETKFKIEITAAIDTPSLALFELMATTAEGISRYGSLTVQLKEAIPIGHLNPYEIKKGMMSGEEIIESISVINAGYNTLKEVTIGSPTLAWISVITDKAVGNIDPQKSRSFNIKIHPPKDLATGQYQDRIDITSSNYQTLSLYINILITTSKVGNVLFIIRDIFSKPVGTASISAASQELKIVTFSGKTDSEGKAFLKDIPAGRYTYWLSASGFNNTGGNIVVESGMDNTVEATMTATIMGVEWTVTPTTIEDEYEVKIKATFETKVPAPQVTITPPTLSFTIQPGKSADAELTIHNMGLISVFNFEIKPLSKPPIIIEALTPIIPELKAKSTVKVPIKVTVLTHASPVTPFCHPYETHIVYDADDYICYNEDGTEKWRGRVNIANTPVTLRTSHADLGLSNYIFHRIRYINCPDKSDYTPNMKLTVCNKGNETVNFCDCGRLRITIAGIVPFLSWITSAVQSLMNVSNDWNSMTPEEFAEKYEFGGEALQEVVINQANVAGLFSDAITITLRIKDVANRAMTASGECADLGELDNLQETLKETFLKAGQEAGRHIINKIGMFPIFDVSDEVSQFVDQSIPPGQCTYVNISGNTSQFFGAGHASFCVRQGNGECCCSSITITDSTWICSEIVSSIIRRISSWIRGRGGRGSGGRGGGGGGYGAFKGDDECPGGMVREPPE